MSTPTEERAIESARQTLATAAAAAAHLVERLDRPDARYYLVLFGPPLASSAVAAVDAATGGVMSAARLSGKGPHLSVDAAQAQRIAALPGARLRLVWQPCTASLSPLYPLWEASDAAATVFVDQRGKRWQTLSAARG